MVGPMGNRGPMGKLGPVGKLGPTGPLGPTQRPGQRSLSHAEAFAQHAQERPEAPALTWLGDHGEETTRLTYAQVSLGY